ncbi:MAG: hypothetical protein CMJ01_03560 [Pelagibacteraceae bacterium]|nr:hypothetical protein [Pelagibacteraceae bacterium]
MRKYFPIIISVLFFLISIMFWDKIKLPYDENNLIIGEYFNKKFNPQNDTIRFIILIVPAVIAYLVTYLKINKNTFNFQINNKDYFLKGIIHENKKSSIQNYTIFFLVLILFEFLMIDFQSFIVIDTFHDSVYLTPATNYLANKEFFKSTLYDYGFVGNNLGLLINYFFDFYNLGTINLIKIIFIFLIKVSLIFLSKKLIESTNFDDFFKKTFFIIFTFLIIGLPSYYDLASYFSPRSLLYLIAIFLICSAISNKKFSNIKFFLIGSLSLISLLWWFDIGFFLNFLLLLLLLYLIIHSQIKSLIYLLLGVSFIWSTFFILTPLDEIRAFFYNLKFIIITTDYLIGIEYLKPFSQNSGRWTKALIIIYICSILLIHLNFSKKYNIGANLKIFLNVIFISGIIIFKSALTRSDAYHLKYTSGLYSLVFIFLALYLFFFFLKESPKVKRIVRKYDHNLKNKINYMIALFFTILFFSGILNVKDKVSISNKFINLNNFNQNITKLVTAKTKDLVKGDNLLILQKYKSLSSKDNCIQYFSDDNFFPYFLSKPSCTKFYLSNQILTNISEKKFISDFQKTMPDIILYESPTKLLFNNDNLQNAMKFVRNNYKFYENYKGFIFYKKIN